MLDSNDLRVRLGDKAVLNGLDLQAAEGEWIGLLGPNGSGKTTLLRTIGGVLPYRGSLRLEDREITTWHPKELARRLAFVRQDTSLVFDFTVEEIVLLGRSPYKGWLDPYTGDDRDRVREALTRLDLVGFEDRSVTALSGGERQLVFLAQALVQEADILLLDEPTNHLDVHHQYEFLGQVEDLVTSGRSVVTAFHDLELAGRYADRIWVLDDGHLVRSGDPAEVLSDTLIEEVFRMEARVRAPGTDTMRIEFHRPA